MDIKIKLIVAASIILALIIIVNMIRKKALELRYALAWLCVGFGVLVLDLFPSLISGISRVMGISTPINMLFFLGFCFSLGIIFILTIAISRMSIRVKELAQRVALNEENDKQIKAAEANKHSSNVITK